MEKDRSSWPAGRYLGMLHSFTRRYFSRAMDEYDLPGKSLMFLGYLSRHDGASQDDIASHFLFNKGYVARTLSRLEDAGLVTREVDEEDRRINRVHLTDEGRKMRKKLKGVGRKWSDQLTAGFSAEERKQLLEYLARMAENAADYLKTDGSDIEELLVRGKKPKK
ncbi:MAG: MarR family winged helix-turn-helix transcriptional regulator [Armatimonadota bacterium]